MTTRGDCLQRRRLLAVESIAALKDKDRGAQSRLAKHFGVSQTSISRWRRSFKQGGTKALLKRTATGRPPKVNYEELANAAARMFRGSARPTVARFAAWIKANFGVAYHHDHLRRIMRWLEEGGFL